MSFLNRPDRLVLDSFSDQNLKNLPNNGQFSRFTNVLNTPLLNVKGLQLLRCNFVNPSLPLSDYNGQLLFVYSRNTTTAIPSDGSTFHVVRLHPSWFVPYAGYTAFTKNKYYNDGTQLVADLNLASSTGGDSTTYNPSWIANDITFTFDTITRKISFTGNTATNYYAPIPADHPALPAFLAGANQVRMNSVNSSNTYATAIPQTYSPNVTMNERVGFGLSYSNRGIFWSASSVLGCATTSGVPVVNGTATQCDSFPILLATQNINIYASVIVGSGNDSRTRKNLLASIPIENAPLGVNSYTLTSIEQPASSVNNEIYNIDINFTDDDGNDFFFLPNMNVSLELAVFY